MDTTSFGRDVVGMFDAKIAELEDQLATLRDLRSMAATRLGVVESHVPARASHPEPDSDQRWALDPTQKQPSPEKTTRADLIAHVMEGIGMPAKVGSLLDASIELGDGKGMERDRHFNAIYTALLRSKKPDGSPRFQKLDGARWWFADRPVPD